MSKYFKLEQLLKLLVDILILPLSSTFVLQNNFMRLRILYDLHLWLRMPLYKLTLETMNGFGKSV